MADFEDELSRADDFDLALTVAIINAAQTEVVHQQKLHEDLLAVTRTEQRNRRHYQKKKRQRVQPEDDTASRRFLFPTWSELSDTITDKIFRRKYRMTKEHFNLLCTRIKNEVGEKAFRPDNATTNHYISGEVRVAIGLRLLCGGSYLDLIGRAYGVESPVTVYNHFHTFTKWIEATFSFPLTNLLRGLESNDPASIQRLREISADFSADSYGTFTGCIGAIDGLAIRIRCPSNVNDPANYFCRKNFHALNVQAICDRQKRILWIDPGHQGASHDSTAWLESNLHDKLSEDWKEILQKHGFFIVGDSAYPLSTYLLVPYPNAKPHSAEDAFNFWLSNSRIQIECTFGELIMRFGLFWRTLRFPDLNVCCRIIRAAAKLHNFLVDCREDTADDDMYFRNLSYGNMASHVDTDSTRDEDDDITFPLVTDNNEPKPMGRPDKKRKMEEVDGEQIRDYLCTSLFEDGFVRPKKKSVRHNSLGHVYFVEN